MKKFFLKIKIFLLLNVKLTRTFSKIHPRLLCRVEGRGGKEVPVENWKEFSRFLTTVLNLRNWRKKVISRENKFTKFSGEIFKTATDSFLASQFNFSMRR